MLCGRRRKVLVCIREERAVKGLFLFLLAGSALFAQSITTLDCGVIVQGSFVQGPNDFYNLTAQPGDVILIRKAIVGGDAGFAPALSVTDPVNRTVAARTGTRGATIEG